jgi:small-conductance mechanosensitive channel
MDELRVKYKTQLSEYDTLVRSALQSQDVSQVPRLQGLNIALSRTLNQMIENLTFLKRETPTITSERDELLDRLKQIQKDYNGLRADTDTLETLRRIRQQEGTEANRQLYMFFLFFLVVCIVIVLYLMFATQKKDNTAPSASMPPTAAALV